MIRGTILCRGGTLDRRAESGLVRGLFHHAGLRTAIYHVIGRERAGEDGRMRARVNGLLRECESARLHRHAGDFSDDPRDHLRDGVRLRASFFENAVSILSMTDACS